MSSRVKVLEIHHDDLVAALGQPVGARMISTCYQRERVGILEIVIEHDSYAEVPDGAALPRSIITNARRRRPLDS